MTKAVKDNVYTYLKTISILVTKRVEISAFLQVLNNKTYEFYQEDRIKIQRLAEKAKKLRVDFKSAERYNQQVSKKGNPLAMLAEVEEYAKNILEDLKVVRVDLIKTHKKLQEQLMASKMDSIIQLDIMHPIDDVIRDLSVLVDNHEQVHLAISSRLGN